MIANPYQVEKIRAESYRREQELIRTERRLANCSSNSCVDQLSAPGISRGCVSYETLAEINANHAVGCYLVEKCDLIGYLVNTAAPAFAIGGREMNYSVKRKQDDEICGGAGNDLSSENEIQCAIDEVIEAHDWTSDFHTELVQRYFTTGDVFRRFYESPDVGPTMCHFDPNDLVDDLVDSPEPFRNTGLTYRDVKERMKFGIAFNTIDEGVMLDADGRSRSVQRLDYSSPIAYVFETEALVDGEMSTARSIFQSDAIQHVKRGVNRCQPRGLSPWPRVLSKSLGKDELSKAVHLMSLRRLDNGVQKVVEGSGAGAESSIDRAIHGEKEKQKKARKKNQVGLYDATDITHNISVLLPDLKLPVTDIIKLVEMDKLTIGQQIGAPDTVSLSRSDMGARATSDSTIRAWYASIREVQGAIVRSNRAFLWWAVSKKLSKPLDRLRQFYVISPDGIIDPAHDQAAEHQRAMELFDRGLIDRETAAEASGYTASDESEEESDPSLFPIENAA